MYLHRKERNMIRLIRTFIDNLILALSGVVRSEVVVVVRNHKPDGRF